MKRVLLILLLLAASLTLRAQDHPFQNPALPEEERLDNAVSLMTVDEKLATLVGMGVPSLGIANPGATEAIHGIVRGGATDLPGLWGGGERVGRPEQRYQHSTAFPQAYGIGETWDREMAHLVGDVMSREARFYSHDAAWKCLILWAPNADLARDPRWGRTEESFGEDPYLVGEMVAAEVRGIQGDDPKYWRGAFLMKHFLANSNEDNRFKTDSRFDEALGSRMIRSITQAISVWKSALAQSSRMERISCPNSDYYSAGAKCSGPSATNNHTESLPRQDCRGPFDPVATRLRQTIAGKTGLWKVIPDRGHLPHGPSQVRKQSKFSPVFVTIARRIFK